jgi:DNA-binding NarL/FixJ family response regulator
MCAEGATAEAAIQLAREHRPDVALLDIHMPGNGIYAAQQISRDLPETALVRLTESNADTDLLGSLRAGASGYPGCPSARSRAINVANTLGPLLVQSGLPGIRMHGVSIAAGRTSDPQ